MDDIKVSDGARKLGEYITAHHKSIYEFCAQHGLERIQVARVLKGARGQRVTVDFAKSIADATGGVVAMELWASDTMRAVENDSTKAAG